jgi:menaquinone-9 beta-reductase
MVESGETNLCGLVAAGRLARHRGRWDSFVEQIRREQPAIEALYSAHEPSHENFLSSDPVIFRPRSPVEEGLLMIGDASGIVDPLAGDGMAMALQCGVLAATAARRMLDDPLHRSDHERWYVSDHADLFCSRIRWSRSIASLLSRPRLLAAALRVGGSGRPSTTSAPSA